MSTRSVGSRIRKSVPAAVAALAVACTLAACSSDEDNTPASEEAQSSLGAVVTSVREQAEGAVSSVQSAAESAAEKAGEAIDQAKLSAFVGTFRTAYPDLAADRETESIEKIVTDTCPMIEDGAPQQDIDATVQELATNGSVEPTDDQAARIAQLVKVACP
ncbi:hypothetical protein ACWDUD_02540 [Rhodococcus sp. NPDC003382]|uniref:hypothetical protein n=1 Tax=unclassified Rhodococcus (in: high G+C Gram-positive bacteria) TaxID=192944 RepID=UPI0018CD04E5|nr:MULTISPECIES: hypothetical protein [unclassified Rhodococcus (in: high G+C Gram-positive bacteria)]MBH0123715.1 hypothetical protein [Rhodococcus sp. CX]MCK8671137.1 hypothetical protein [Rhodococcus sp. HM1]